MSMAVAVWHLIGTYAVPSSGNNLHLFCAIHVAILFPVCYSLTGMGPSHDKKMTIDPNIGPRSSAIHASCTSSLMF